MSDRETPGVEIPWRGGRVAVSPIEWAACRRFENLVTAGGLGFAAAIFVAGLQTEGLLQVAVVLFIAIALVYFDGYVARFCAARKARARSGKEGGG